jgi:hypothetical protein
MESLGKPILKELAMYGLLGKVSFFMSILLECKLIRVLWRRPYRFSNICIVSKVGGMNAPGMTDGGVSKGLHSPFFFSRPLSSRSSNIKGSNKDDLAEQRERD